ncbi:hypothetical protein [Vibrio tritonius]|uniref:hypothetical protein n=1 Tax=Vibrio tritonius TaxID=1435069 RepID=UPI00315D1558
MYEAIKIIEERIKVLKKQRDSEHDLGMHENERAMSYAIRELDFVLSKIKQD